MLEEEKGPVVVRLMLGHTIAPNQAIAGACVWESAVRGSVLALVVNPCAESHEGQEHQNGCDGSGLPQLRVWGPRAV